MADADVENVNSLETAEKSFSFLNYAMLSIAKLSAVLSILLLQTATVSSGGLLTCSYCSFLLNQFHQ